MISLSPADVIIVALFALAVVAAVSSELKLKTTRRPPLADNTVSFFRHNLGDRVKDVISGGIGIVTSRSEHLFGCNRYWIEPQELKDGKPVEGRWLDEEAVQLVDAGAVQRPAYARVVVPAVAQQPVRRAGGPTTQPSSASPQNGR